MSDKIKKSKTEINEHARIVLDISRDEYSLCDYILFRGADPRMKKDGWCTDTKDVIADFVGITRPGLYKMLDRMTAKNLLEPDPARGFFRVTPYFIDMDNNANADTVEAHKCKLSLQSGSEQRVNLVYRQRKLSLQSGVNLVTDIKELDLSKSKTEITHSVVSHETTAFSSPIENELHSTPGAAAGVTAWPVEVFEPATLEIVETEPTPLPDSTDDTQPGDPAKAKYIYTPEFEAFWKSYNYAAGSKLTASKRWLRLSAKEKSLALSALDAHLRGTTTDKSRRKDVPFLPMRCHAAVYLSEKRWEAYGEQAGVQRGESTTTPWDEKYKAYLKTCEKKWPDALASVAYLSKTEYCSFQEGKYIQGIGRIGEEMQKARLGRCHDKWERAEPEARKHSSIWQFFLLDMSNCIKLSNSI